MAGRYRRGFGTSDRHLAYRILRTWLHCLRDRLSVEVAAHFDAQLPELLRGVFFGGWNPSRVPQKYDRAAYVTRFAREARIRDSDVVKAQCRLLKQRWGVGGFGGTVWSRLGHCPDMQRSSW